MDNRRAGSVQVLKQWINPQYLSAETMQQIEKQFSSNPVPHIQLAQFLLPQKAEEIRKALEKIKWQHQYIPHMHSYALGNASGNTPINQFFSFLDSNGFKVFLGTMLRKEIKTIEKEMLLFQHRDYTLLHDSRQEKDAVLCCFDFTKDWLLGAGGETVVVSKTEPLLFPRLCNALTLVQLKPDIHYFLKYVNAKAEKRKIFLIQMRLL